MQAKLLEIYDKYTEYKKPLIRDQSYKSLLKVRQKLVLSQGKKYKLDLNDLSIKWYTTWVKNMSNGKIGKCNNKTIKLYSTILISFLEQAKVFGYKVNPDYKKFKYHIKTYKKSKIYKAILTDDEIVKIWQLNDLTKNQEYVKDLFLFQCNTGLRWSDLSRIKHNNFIENDGELYITNFETLKNSADISIHINKMAKYIINKYVKKMSYNKNIYLFKNVNSCSNATNIIKKLAKKANIDRLIIDNIGYGNKKIIRKRKFHRALSTHCARHTFANKYMKQGGDLYNLKLILGHASIVTTESYLKSLPDYIPSNIKVKLSNKLLSIFE